eukprot:TRINITY_DN98_c0_g1_i2.p1 TRINITY_DN98_c0_g1~~TRINITY_DN98_c0_g1_i2.p1  ORF type:complete len:104 (-),score=11.15 TRINITY_DN98_c0_g1_i2:167-457(-)
MTAKFAWTGTVPADFLGKYQSGSFTGELQSSKFTHGGAWTPASAWTVACNTSDPTTCVAYPMGSGNAKILSLETTNGVRSIHQIDPTNSSLIWNKV